VRCRCEGHAWHGGDVVAEKRTLVRTGVTDRASMSVGEPAGAGASLNTMCPSRDAPRKSSMLLYDLIFTLVMVVLG